MKPDEGEGTTRVRRDVQGLRAIAVLLVVVFHAGVPLPGGFTGVDVFFVISGFVITGTLLAELGRTGRISLVSFYARRIRRLLPALAVVIGFVCTFGILFAPLAVQPSTASAGLWASLFVGNVFFYRSAAGYFDLDTALNPLLHTWTLGVEEQFYAFFPALLLVSWWLARASSPPVRRAVLGAAIATVTVGSYALWTLGSRGTLPGVAAPEQFAFYMSPARAWEFGLGALVAVGVPIVRRLAGPTAATLGLAGVAAVAVGAVVIGDSRPPAEWMLLPTLGTAAAIAAGTSGGPAARLLGLKPLVWIGDRSYSWYLWHWPLIVFAEALFPASSAAVPAAAMLSLAPAAASYRLVENRVRFDRRLRGRKTLVIAAVAVAAPMLTVAGLRVGNDLVRRSDEVRAWEHAQQHHVDYIEGCASPTPLDARDAGDCVWASEGASGLVVLAGDSNAGHVSEAFLAAAAALDRDALIATSNGCPFVDVFLSGTDSGVLGCREFYEGTVREIVRMRPDLVVFAARSDRYIESDDIGLAAAGSDPLLREPTPKERIWQQGLESTLRTLSAAGIPALVVHPVPLRPTAVSACAALRILLDACTDDVTRADLAPRQERAFRAERRAVETVRGAAALDVRAALCDASSCASRRDGVDLYRNRTHLSVAGAMAVEGELEAAMLRRLRGSTG